MRLPSFVFDIDGVLLRGPNVLQPALEAMRKIYDDGGGWRYPTAFLTNGGGMLESEKAKQLSEKLHVEVKSEQVILSHSPMRGLAETLSDRPVLLSGRGKVMEVAAAYGFNKAVHTSQVAAAFPSAVPFSSTQRYSRCLVSEEGYGTQKMPIEAILVMNDPCDWYRDAQLIVDCLLSGGVLDGSVAEGNVQEKVPSLYFSNPDLLWANDFGRSRYGQGAFGLIVETLYKSHQAQPVKPVYFGKPNPQPYRLAEVTLARQAKAMGINANAFIFAVGDNPAADILGANRAGDHWVSCLVQTGVFKAGSEPSVKPSILVGDVSAAIDAALHRMRQEHWHSLR
jgi:HAD superfamily hydrolase (TIGR01456 family)